MAKFKIVLDKRTPKANGKYPLKLRVTNYNEARFISLQADYSAKEFKEVFKDIPDAKWIQHRDAAIKVQEKAEKIGANLIPFDYKKFKVLLFLEDYSERPKTVFVSDLFDMAIKKHRSKDSIRTANSYNTAKNCLIKFRQLIRVEDITEQFLNDFEAWFIYNHEGKLTATLGIYLRYLRAIVNLAIAKRIVHSEYRSPFNKHLYSIPVVKKAKKTLSVEEVEKLVSYDEFENADERIARDLWLFQFRCNGVNLKDLLLLRWDQQVDDCFVLTREKTKRTTRGNPHPIRIPITPKLNAMLDQVGRRDSPYVLGFMKEGMDETKILDKRSKVAKYLNSHLRPIADRLKLSVPLQTKTARDSYATCLKNKGVRIEIISENMGHTSINTTRHYLDSFDPRELHKANNLLP